MEFEEYSSWEARCGTPAGFPFKSGSTGSDGWYSFGVLTAADAALGATRVRYFRIESNDVVESYLVGGTFDIPGTAFSFQNQPNINTPLGASILLQEYDQNFSLVYFDQVYLDVNFSLSSATGLYSWAFRLAAQHFDGGSSEKAWTSSHPFYSQTSDDQKCISSSTLSPCRDSDFHLPSDVLFSCTKTGVSVTVGGQTTSYGWAANSPALTFTRTFDIWIRRKFSCFQDCDFETNLCCNPLP